MLNVVLETVVLLRAVTNSRALSFQPNTAESWLPRRPIVPMSSVGAPDVCPSANVINGSWIRVLTVSTVVVCP